MNTRRRRFGRFRTSPTGRSASTTSRSTTRRPGSAPTARWPRGGGLSGTCGVAALVSGVSPLRRPGDALVGVPDVGHGSALVVRTRSSSVQPCTDARAFNLQAGTRSQLSASMLCSACLQDWTAILACRLRSRTIIFFGLAYRHTSFALEVLILSSFCPHTCTSLHQRD